MSNLKYDPEFLKLIQAANMPPAQEPTDAHHLRKASDALIAMITSFFPPSPGLTETTFSFTTADGTSLPIYQLTPSTAKQQEGPQPAIIFIHGGGMVAGSVALFKPSAEYYAAQTGLKVFCLSYRLAPEFPFPTPLEDIYSGVKWLQSHAAEHNIDPARIAICGTSAGGGLAAGVGSKPVTKG